MQSFYILLQKLGAEAWEHPRGKLILRFSHMTNESDSNIELIHRTAQSWWLSNHLFSCSISDGWKRPYKLHDHFIDGA